MRQGLTVGTEATDTDMASTQVVYRQSVQRFWVAVLVIMAAMIIVPIVIRVATRSYVDLLPDRTDDEFTGALAIGIFAMVASIAALLYHRPKLQSSLAVAVLVLGPITFLIGFILAIMPMAGLFKIYDFRHRPLVEFYAYLRVEGFHIRDGRGASYDLDLADFSPSLDLYYDDYRWNAGDRDSLTVSGKCIRVLLQRSGRALRVVQPEHVHAVPCPLDTKLIESG